MADVEFVDNRLKVNRAIEDAIGQFLFEASGELVSQTARATPVDTGQLKGSWKANVDESVGEAVIGSELENAIWNEFGTGEYAAKGNGRKGGWFYVDKKGEGHFTHGKHPNRTFEKAYNTTKTKIVKRAEQIFKSKFSD